MKNQHMTPALARAARAVLSWSMHDMAEATGVSVVTIRDYENATREPLRLTRVAMARVYWDEGIEFIGGPDATPGLLIHRTELLRNPPRPRNRS